MAVIDPTVISKDGERHADAPHPHQRHFLLAGFSSGCLTRFMCHPLDVLKIRFQLQIEPIKRSSKSSKYRTVTQTFSCIIREESVYALWKGHVSAQLLSGFYGMAYFSSFELFNQCANEWLVPDDLTRERTLQAQPLIHFFCGSLSGFCATSLSHPFDVVRTRIICQSENPKTYLNTRHAFKSLISVEGFPGLYRGFLPTITQIMPFSGAQFASYNLFKRLWWQHYESDHIAVHLHGELALNLQASFLCGALSGTVAKFLVYPMDVIKKRLQVRGFEQARGTNFGAVPHYQGFVHCIVHTIENETFAALYKGLVPSLFKATLTTALNFWFYETMLKVLLNAEDKWRKDQR